MTLDRAKELCPKLFGKIDQEIFTDRDLIIVDHNYEEEDGEEAGDLNPDEYNYFVYLPEASLKVIQGAGLNSVISAIGQHEAVDAFIVLEEDLYGIKSDFDEDALVELLLVVLEDNVS